MKLLKIQQTLIEELIKEKNTIATRLSVEIARHQEYINESEKALKQIQDETESLKFLLK